MIDREFYYNGKIILVRKQSWKGPYVDPFAEHN